MDKNTTIDSNRYMREVCALHVIQKFDSGINSANIIVETDESLFVRRKKIAVSAFPHNSGFRSKCL